jgi:hypothetical protein
MVLLQYKFSLNLYTHTLCLSKIGGSNFSQSHDGNKKKIAAAIAGFPGRTFAAQ